MCSIHELLLLGDIMITYRIRTQVCQWETLYSISSNYLPYRNDVRHSLTPVLWKDETEDEVVVLEEINVDIDGGANCGQKTGQITRAFWNRTFYMYLYKSVVQHCSSMPFLRKLK